VAPLAVSWILSKSRAHSLRRTAPLFSC
jgi:hypothetical protein